MQSGAPKRGKNTRNTFTICVIMLLLRFTNTELTPRYDIVGISLYNLGGAYL